MEREIQNKDIQKLFCRFHLECKNFQICHTCLNDDEAITYCGIAKEKMKQGV